MNACSISKIEASKLADEKRSIRDCCVNASSGRAAAPNVAKPECVTTTPFGVPVEPEV